MKRIVTLIIGFVILFLLSTWVSNSNNTAEPNDTPSADTRIDVVPIDIVLYN